MRGTTAIAISCLIILGSCATQPEIQGYDPPGFLWGLLHGVIAIPALVESLFWDIRIYAVPNAGRWYDFGFVLGLGLIGAGWLRD
jgi:hypothetical protein